MTMPERSGRSFTIGGPLIVTVQNDDKTLARRTFSDIDVPSTGNTSRAVYLQNIGCTGGIEITAHLGKQTETAQLNMACGE